MPLPRVLEGRRALVTGASRGIGEFIARRFAAAGAAVAVTARTTEVRDERFPGTIHDTVAAIEVAGGQAVALAADLSKPEERSTLVERATAALGPIDVLVNNAAVTWFGPLESFADKRYDLMFDVQVRTPIELARAALPGMRAKGAGWILNISSGAARHPQGPPFQPRAGVGTVYGMCKAALERFTTGFAAELYEDGVAVNVLSPAGLVRTPGVVHHRLERPGIPLEEPAVMAEASLALCSGDPKQLTGRVCYSQPLLDELSLEPALLG